MSIVQEYARDLMRGHVIRQGNQWCFLHEHPERIGNVLRVRMRNEAGRAGVWAFGLDERVTRLVEDDD